MALRKFSALNRAEPEVDDTPHEAGPMEEAAVTAEAPEASAASTAAAPTLNEYEKAALEALTEVAAAPASAPEAKPVASDAPPGSPLPSADELADSSAATTASPPEDENLGNDSLVARLRPEDRKEYDQTSTPEAKAAYLKGKLAAYEAEKRQVTPEDLQPDDQKHNPFELTEKPKPLTAADLVAGLMAAPAIAAVQAAAHAGSALLGAASKGQRAYSERKVRNKIYEAKMNELRQNTGSMLDASEGLGKSVVAFNEAYLNSGAAAQLRKAAEAEGIGFDEMMINIRDGKAKKEHMAIAREALNDPSVSAAWDKVNQDHGKFQNAKSAITENCEMLSKNFTNRFDHEAVADSLHEAGEVALSKVPDPVYENPDEPKLKEKMKEMLEQVQEMVRNLINKIAEAFRPK